MSTYACYLSIAYGGIGLPLELHSILISLCIPPGPLASEPDELLIAPGAPEEIWIFVNLRVNHFKLLFELSVDFRLIQSLFRGVCGVVLRIFNQASFQRRRLRSRF